MKIRYWALSLLMIAGAIVRADDISIGYPGHGGNGCPQGTVSATLSPDAKQLSILFDEYIVEAKGSTTLDRKSCNITVPVHVPNGISVSILQVDYRGYNGLPRGASSTLAAEYFFADRPGPKVSRTFYGALDRDYYESHKLAATAMIWSPCGKDVNLRINSSMRVRTNSAGQQALATVDSIDLSAGMIFHLQFRKCTR